MMSDVSLDNFVEDMAANEPEVTINGCGSTAGKVPSLWKVMGKCGISMLKECDGN